MVHNVTTMAAVVAAMGAKLGTQRKAASKAGLMAQVLLEHVARQAPAARRGASVECADKAQKEFEGCV